MGNSFKTIMPLGPNSGTTTKPDEQTFAGFVHSLGRLTPESSDPGVYVFLDFDNDPSEKLPKNEGRAPAILVRQEPSVVRP